MGRIRPAALAAGLLLSGGALAGLAVPGAGPASGASTPGTAPPHVVAHAVPHVSSPTSLSPLTTFNCQCSISVDGIATNDPAGAPVQVQKNAGATVRVAYLLAASTGFSSYTPTNTDVTLAGSPVSWNSAETVNNNIGSVNVEADVTSIVKPLIDAASPGITKLTVAEGQQTDNIDGEALAVIFNDPTMPANNSIILMYGAQATAGSNFAINLGSPIDTTNPSQTVTMGIGDSFGYQGPPGGGQDSVIKVDGTLMTSSAGGQDDCAVKYDATPNWASCGDGQLFTVGGVGDSTANPPDPTATDVNCAAPGPPRCDDELYNLLPFVKSGDSSINVFTQNPSNDDNIFFAWLNLTDISALVGEGILLSPASGSDPVGASHTVTATVIGPDGKPAVGQTVDFSVVSGPNAGKTGSGVTDSTGKAAFTYSSSAAGTDTIEATFTDSSETKFTSNQVTEAWTSVTTSGTTTTTTTTAPARTPVPGVTTVHTGEPWAGARPLEVVVLAVGLLLVGLGLGRRRVARAR